MGEAPMEGCNEFRICGVVGFIGCGNMAKAIAFPLFAKGVIDPRNVVVSARGRNNSKDWAELGCSTFTANEDVITRADIIVWAVKPQIFPGAISSLSSSLTARGFRYPTPGKVIPHISVMAGIPLVSFYQAVAGLTQSLGGSPRCFRTMPNIGLQVGCGVAVFTGPPDITETEKHLLHSFFKPNGLSYEVAENQINAYAGLFGSGIGFMFPILEAMSDGAVQQGIPRDVSLEIAAQTMKGAGELLLKEKKHPGELKDSVCSPGGTTICGIAAMEAGGVRSAMIKAIEATVIRSQQLGGAGTGVSSSSDSKK